MHDTFLSFPKLSRAVLGKGDKSNFTAVYHTIFWWAGEEEIVTVNLKSGSSTDKNTSKFQRVRSRMRHLANATRLIQFADLV